MTQLKSQPYLEYLDKEMTIMGILSAFATTFAGLTLERTVSAKAHTPLAILWVDSGVLVAGAAGSAVVAALLFYLQRSLLAWYYGQVTLSEVREDTKEVAQLLTDADSWPTWARYQLGFVALYLSFGLVGVSVLRLLHPPLARISPWGLLLPFAAIALAYGVLIRYLLNKFAFEDDSPLTVLWRRWRRK